MTKWSDMQSSSLQPTEEANLDVTVNVPTTNYRK